MSSIPSLLMLGNRFFVALLKEAQVALQEDDWRLASERLREFETHMKRHREGESEVLYPRILTLNPDLEGELDKLGQDYSEMAGLTQIALEALEARAKYRCDQIIQQLSDVTSGHWMTQENVIYSLAHAADDQLLKELASRLIESEPWLDNVSEHDGRHDEAASAPDSTAKKSPDVP